MKFVNRSFVVSLTILDVLANSDRPLKFEEIAKRIYESRTSTIWYTMKLSKEGFVKNIFGKGYIINEAVLDYSVLLLFKMFDKTTAPNVLLGEDAAANKFLAELGGYLQDLKIRELVERSAPKGT